MTKINSTAVTHWKNKFNTDYLGSYSLDKGKELILTIKGTTQKEVKDPKGGSSLCFVCEFVENVKPMILNRTNCKIISKIYGTPYIEEWTGFKIQIYSQSDIKAFGDTVDALRIRAIIPTGEIAKAPVNVTKEDLNEQLHLVAINKCATLENLKVLYTNNPSMAKNPNVVAAKDKRKAELTSK